LLSPGVRPSVTFVYCIQKDEDIVKLLSQFGSPIVLVFVDSERRYPIQEAPRQLGAQITLTHWTG